MRQGDTDRRTETQTEVKTCFAHTSPVALRVPESPQLLITEPPTVAPKAARSTRLLALPSLPLDTGRRGYHQSNARLLGPSLPAAP